ncbi:pyridoxal phosphate-dependent transferase [Massariosphaeria phaeospora]|uniref:Pyridoxal phosphate-dependent transferase n=1 Tax=Massariosphaeria phaeospora TaxID=100035 RepID=A0A7C8M760_9PLEO|nr:pyridoxal phosphate-dependent transferase [Massariosphaeria phaeospora]
MVTSTTPPTLAVQETKKKFGKELRKEFLFDEKWLNLNHGSFGTYPRAIQTVLCAFQDDVEAHPDKFIWYTYPQRLDESREAMSKLLNVPASTLVFVPNATTGINTVLRNLIFTPSDKILYFSTIYGACHKTITYITETTPAEAVKVEYTYPVEDDWLVSAFKEKVKEVERNGGKVKIAVFDTVVSMPGLRMPFEKLVAACKELDVLSCVDAAHGVGHVELDLGALDPDFLVSNCHKWLYVPRGCAIFHVPLRNQPLLRSTLPTSHGFSPRPAPGQAAPPQRNPVHPSGAKSAWVKNFEFVGTIDNAPYLCIPAALQWRADVLGGEAAIRTYCFDLNQRGAARVAQILGTEVLDNETRTLTQCCLANVRLPMEMADIQRAGVQAGMQEEDVGPKVWNWMCRTLATEYATYMAILFYGGVWWVRMSAQVYLEVGDYEWGARTVKELCGRVGRGEWIGEEVDV